MNMFVLCWRISSLVLIVLMWQSNSSSAFMTTVRSSRSPTKLCYYRSNENNKEHETYPSSSLQNAKHDLHRRTFLTSSFGLLGGFTQGSMMPRSANANTNELQEGEGVTLYKTLSGLKYIELEPGQESKSTPRYGQLCVISYKAYLKLPNRPEKQAFDTSGSFVIKHGSGRMIAGLDEGIHTMKPGELRRLIIPPKLGFVESGLGPLPRYPWDRMKLNSLLDQMVAQQGGNLVYDVRLEKVFDDEADQGYYDDTELSPEEMQELQNKLLKNRSNTG